MFLIFHPKIYYSSYISLIIFLSPFYNNSEFNRFIVVYYLYYKVFNKFLVYQFCHLLRNITYFQVIITILLKHYSHVNPISQSKIDDSLDIFYLSKVKYLLLSFRYKDKPQIASYEIQLLETRYLFFTHIRFFLTITVTYI